MNCLKPFVWRTIRTIHYKPKLTFLGGSRRTRPNSDYRLMTRYNNKKRLTEELLWSKKGTVRLLFHFIHLDTERKDRCVCGTIKIPVHFFPPFDRKKNGRYWKGNWNQVTITFSTTPAHRLNHIWFSLNSLPHVSVAARQEIPTLHRQRPRL